MIGRRYLRLAAGAAMLAAVPAAAEDGASLFFTPDEVRNARAFRDHGALPSATARPERRTAPEPHTAVEPLPAPIPVRREPPPDIRLGALMYWGPSNWVVWINGAPYRPGSEPPPFRVVAVTGGYAEVEWRSRDGGSAVRARLEPNQMRRGATGEIVSGAPTLR